MEGPTKTVVAGNKKHMRGYLLSVSRVLSSTADEWENYTPEGLGVSRKVHEFYARDIEQALNLIENIRTSLLDLPRRK